MASSWIKKEFFARILLVLIIIGIPAGIIVWGQETSEPDLMVQAAVPEDGGWIPGTIKAEVGKPLNLQFTSLDVVHGFSVGSLDTPDIDVLPGEITQTRLVFSEPGRYVYYCTRWCSPNHWRMRGTIIVEGDDQVERDPDLPLYVELGLDIDTERSADILPDTKPSWQDGTDILARISKDELDGYNDPNYLRTTSPIIVWKALRGEVFTTELNDQELWNLVAALWRSSTTSEGIQSGQELYNQNCAACHGIDGDGEGIFAGQYSPGEIGSSDLLRDITTPADFTDSEQMLATNSAILEGKMLRGGMGTGMPNFGPIFTNSEIWSIIDYIWAFQFSDRDR